MFCSFSRLGLPLTLTLSPHAGRGKEVASRPFVSIIIDGPDVLVSEDEAGYSVVPSPRWRGEGQGEGHFECARGNKT
jgi:hypothetical protein